MPVFGGKELVLSAAVLASLVLGANGFFTPSPALPLLACRGSAPPSLGGGICPQRRARCGDPLIPRGVEGFFSPPTDKKRAPPLRMALWDGLGGFFSPPPEDQKRFRKAAVGEEAASAVIDISQEDELESLLFQSDMVDKTLVIDWYASWCRKCIAFEPRFTRIALDNRDTAIFARVDGLELEYNGGRSGAGSLKRRCGVTKYPTFQVWKKGVLVAEGVADNVTPLNEVDRDLRRMIKDWEEKEPEPLRLTGVGKTKKTYEGKGIDGGGGGGRGGGSGGGGGSAREFGK